MINVPVIIASDSTILQMDTLNISEEVIFAFEISSASFFEEFTLTLLHESKLIENEKVFFSFFINSSKTKELIKIITEPTIFVQYFFHPQFYKKNNEIVLFCEKEIDFQINKEMNELVVKQGYLKIQQISFLYDFFNEKNNYCFNKTKSDNDISEVYFNLLNSYYYSRYVGIHATDFMQTLKIMIETEVRLSTNNKQKYDFLINSTELKRNIFLLNQELSQLKTALDNQTTYLNFYKNKDEALKLYQFYQNEYEILPLWYKRLGHIIKVIMGKRSFRSLFDNNVKKYKN